MKLLPPLPGGLFTKYALAFVAVVGGVLLLSGAVQGYFAYQESRDSIGDVQRGQAALAASDINNYLRNREEDLRFLFPRSRPISAPRDFVVETPEQRMDDYDRLLSERGNQTLFADLTYLDVKGQERIHGIAIGGAEVQVVVGADLSQRPEYTNALGGKTYIGPVRTAVVGVQGEETVVTLAVGRLAAADVIMGTLRLRFVGEAVRRIKVEGTGRAFVVDSAGLLIGYPDSTVDEGTDLSSLKQVKRALDNPVLPGAENKANEATGSDGKDVLTSYETMPLTGWTVFVEQPSSEALAPLNDVIARTAVLMVGGLVLAVVASLLLARQIVTPIRALRLGAASIAEGDLAQRIDVRRKDEIGALAGEFNQMAARLSESYATLETKVEERTRELAETNGQLEIASRHKSEFLANMSHELRTPLNAIIGYSELLSEEAADLGDEAYLPDLAKIGSAAKHQLALINDILDLSKIEAGRMTIFDEEFEVAALVEDVTAVVRPLMEKNGNRLVVELPAEIGLMTADQTKLRQALFNLLSNAAKFTDGGTVTLAVEPAADRLTFRVADTGIGITDEQMGRLFQPFSQAETSTSRKYGGTGLGLALSREFCRAMGGDITAASTPGEGSVFTIVLPRVAAPGRAAF